MRALPSIILAVMIIGNSMAEDCREDDMNLSRLVAIAAVTACPVALEAETYTGRIASGQSGPERVGGTVVVALALSDGLVLAADSRLIITIPDTKPGYKIASDSTPKLFNIGQVAMAHYGTAFLLGRSVNSFVYEFQATLKDSKLPVDEVAKQFSEFFGKFYDQETSSKQPPKEPPLIGFILAGYDSAGMGSIQQLEFPSQRTPLKHKDTHDHQGGGWFGQVEVITRLIKGYDRGLVALPSVLSMEPGTQEQLTKDLPKLEYFIPFKYFMLQDGIDFALAMVQATVDMQRFSYGTNGVQGSIPGVGGAVDVVAVTPSELIWVRRKALAAK